MVENLDYPTPHFSLFSQIGFPNRKPRRTMEISRNFWERALPSPFIPYKEDEKLAHRFSRHLHDLARLWEKGYATEHLEKNHFYDKNPQ